MATSENKTSSDPGTEEARLNEPASLALVDKIIEGLAIAALLFTLASLRYWPDLPDRIPSNFDTGGIPTVWRTTSFFLLLPVLSAALYAGLTWVSRYPHTYSYPVQISDANRIRQYVLALRLLRLVKAEILILFAHIQHTTHAISLGSAAGIGSWHLPVSLFTVLGSVGIYLVIARRCDQPPGQEVTL